MKQVCASTVLLLALLGTQARAQMPSANENAPSLKFKHQAGKRVSAWYVDRIVYGGEPAFRIRAHHYHGYCNGYLFITPTRIAYVPAFTPEQKDGVSLARRDIVSATPRFAGYDFSTTGKIFSFAFLSSPDTPFTPGDSDRRESLLNFISLALSDFPRANSEFLAWIVGQENGAVARRTIRVLDPQVSAQGGTVEGTAAVQPVLGVASAPGGIRSVTVNGFPAELTPLSNDVVEFRGKPLRVANLAQGQFAVVATGADNTNAQLAFRVISPGVQIISPAPNARVSDPNVTVKGVVTGVHDLRRLDFSGKIVPVNRLTDGSYGFQVVDMPLNMGPNLVPGFYERENGVRYPFYAVIDRGRTGLSFDSIVRGLRSGVTVNRMATLVEQKGVDFDELTREQESQLRSAGANKTLIEAIKNAIGP